MEYARASPVLERDSYEARSERSFASGHDDANNTITCQTPRGFTGPEELSDSRPRPHLDFTYFSFNKPQQISQGAVYQNFLYDTEHARIRKAAPEGGTLYFDAFGMHVEWLNNSTWYDYIIANGGFVAMRVSGATTATRYFHADNLGSISVFTNETAAVVERDGYDAWGKRRFPTGADDPKFQESLPLFQPMRPY